jgi:hypothetical protein
MLVLLCNTKCTGSVLQHHRKRSQAFSVLHIRGQYIRVHTHASFESRMHLDLVKMSENVLCARSLK